MTENEIIRLPNGLDAVIHGGIPRVLGKLPPKPHVRAMMASYAGNAPVLDPSQWKEVNRRDVFGDQYVLDQKSHGSCVGFSSTCALMKSRTLQGMGFVKLSGAFTYSLINGGSDNGSMIHDSIAALTSVGTCTEAEAGWDAIYPNRYPSSARQTASRFKLSKAYTVNSWAEAVSAIQLGFVLELAVMVGGSFANVDSNGVAGFDRGPGNHAVHADGVKQVNGQWTLDAMNTWGLGFGQRGRMLLTQRHFESVDQDSYADLAALDDPQDKNPPPVG